MEHQIVKIQSDTGRNANLELRLGVVADSTLHDVSEILDNLISSNNHENIAWVYAPTNITGMETLLQIKLPNMYLFKTGK
jgi:hypothetical protein